MAIGSSSPREIVDYVVREFSLRRWIDEVVTGSDMENGKPHPDIYLRCAELLNVSHNRCVVVEDSPNGIAAGKNACMRVCAFTGTNIHNFNLQGADLEINDYTEASFAKFAEFAGIRL